MIPKKKDLRLKKFFRWLLLVLRNGYFINPWLSRKMLKIINDFEKTGQKFTDTNFKPSDSILTKIVIQSGV